MSTLILNYLSIPRLFRRYNYKFSTRGCDFGLCGNKRISVFWTMFCQDSKVSV